MSALLEVRGLRTSFATDAGRFNAVDGVSFAIQPGRTLGIVGESGCGKSVTALSIMGLIAPPGRIDAGEILFEGADLRTFSPALMRALREETGAAIILITHDLGVIAEMAQDVAVMYAGRIVERAGVAELFARPQHPYTIGLLGSIPKLHLERETLTAIQGQVPNPAQMPAGCRFMPRCPFSTDKCRDDPPLAAITAGDEAACWYAPLEEKSAAGA